jgi:hypothetical protein
MKKFTMLGVPLLVFLAAMTQASFSAETKKAGGETAKILAIGEVSTFQSDWNANFTTGEKMNIPTTTLVSSDAKNDAAKNNAEIMAIVEVSTGGIAKDEADALLLVETKTAATEIKTNATGGAGIMPEETAIISNSTKTGTKNKVEQKNNCNCASCIEMTKNASISSMGGNSV